MNASKFSNFTIDHILGTQHPVSETMSASRPAIGGLANSFQSHTNGSNGYQSYSGPMTFPTYQLEVPDWRFCSNYYSCGSLNCYHANFSTYYFEKQQKLIYEAGSQTEQSYWSQTVRSRQRSRIRTVFTESQTKQLDLLFNITDYPSVEARAELANNTGLTDETVRVWFKNRRARRKRQNATRDNILGPFKPGRSVPDTNSIFEDI